MTNIKDVMGWRKESMFLLNGKNIVIYALGQEYEKQKSFLQERFNIVGYCDSKDLNMEKYISKKDLLHNAFDYIYVTSDKYYQEIKKELVLLGIAEDKIITEFHVALSDLCESYEKKEFGRNRFHVKYGDKSVDMSFYYGDIYAPLYNPVSDRMPECGPEIYNKDGKRMEIFFIRDENLSHDPYFSGKNFFWDRHNWKLNTHFYVEKAMTEIMGNPERRFGVILEPRSIIPEFYGYLEKNKAIYSEYDKIFTCDAELLEKIPNAKLWHSVAHSWYGKSEEGLNDRADAHKYKTKNISMIASNKTMCRLHEIRRDIALKCKKEGWADTYGQFDGGGYLPNIDATLKEYRYQIVVENQISPLYFTEKIISCFDAQTVPVYLGATEIGKFFNEDGIITLREEDLDNLDKILSQCNERDYEQRLPAILDNYSRVKEKYRNSWDLLYDTYLRQ